MSNFRRMSIADALDHAKRDNDLALKILGKPLPSANDGAENAFAMAAGFPITDIDVHADTEKMARRARWARKRGHRALKGL